MIAAMKTAIIERHHVYGTCNFNVRVMYRGRVLTWRDTSSPGYVTAMAHLLDDGPEVIERARTLARRRGFTHCRFTGDWSGHTKPRDGKL